jgi:hypothetical protein
LAVKGFVGLHIIQIYDLNVADDRKVRRYKFRDTEMEVYSAVKPARDTFLAADLQVLGEND